jgi:hypothetical protein
MRARWRARRRVMRQAGHVTGLETGVVTGLRAVALAEKAKGAVIVRRDERVGCLRWIFAGFQIVSWRQRRRRRPAP